MPTERLLWVLVPSREISSIIDLLVSVDSLVGTGAKDAISTFKEMGLSVSELAKVFQPNRAAPQRSPRSYNTIGKMEVRTADDEMWGRLAKLTNRDVHLELSLGGFKAQELAIYRLDGSISRSPR
jgi:hypothetical protein